VRKKLIHHYNFEKVKQDLGQMTWQQKITLSIQIDKINKILENTFDKVPNNLAIKAME
jgi:predicted Zn-dependent protease with MMP-like domain